MRSRGLGHLAPAAAAVCALLFAGLCVLALGTADGRRPYGAAGCRHATSPSSRTRSGGTIRAADGGVPGQAYNIDGGSRISMLDVLQIIAAELPDLTIRHEPAQQGNARDTASDVSLAQERFG